MKHLRRKEVHAKLQQLNSLFQQMSQLDLIPVISARQKLPSPKSSLQTVRPVEQASRLREWHQFKRQKSKGREGESGWRGLAFVGERAQVIMMEHDQQFKRFKLTSSRSNIVKDQSCLYYPQKPDLRNLNDSNYCPEKREKRTADESSLYFPQKRKQSSSVLFDSRVSGRSKARQEVDFRRLQFMEQKKKSDETILQIKEQRVRSLNKIREMNRQASQHLLSFSRNLRC